jgi:flagellar biosynthesis protein FlhG
LKDHRRLGKGLQDVSHLFLSAEESSQPSRSEESSSETPDAHRGEEPFPRVVAVTGDHRCLEKAFLVCNVAVELSRRRRQVRVVDADPSFPDQPFLWGRRPGDSLGRLAEQEDGHEPQVILEGPLGIKLLSLDIDLRHLKELPEMSRERIWSGLRSFEADAHMILVNTPASVHENARLIHRLAHQIVVMVPSDPLGMMDAYSVIKSILSTRPHVTLGIVVYQVRMISEAQSIFEQMTRALSEFLNVTVVNLGYLFADVNIERSILQRTPLSLTPARSKAAQCLAQIAERIWIQPGSRDQTDRSFFHALRQALEASR